MQNRFSMTIYLHVSNFTTTLIYSHKIDTAWGERSNKIRRMFFLLLSPFVENREIKLVSDVKEQTGNIHESWDHRHDEQIHHLRGCVGEIQSREDETVQASDFDVKGCEWPKTGILENLTK